jgi:hypothetical protein
VVRPVRRRPRPGRQPALHRPAALVFWPLPAREGIGGGQIARGRAMLYRRASASRIQPVLIEVTIPLASHEEAILVLGPYDRHAKLMRQELDIEIYHAQRQPATERRRRGRREAPAARRAPARQAAQGARGRPARGRGDPAGAGGAATAEADRRARLGCRGTRLAAGGLGPAVAPSPRYPRAAVAAPCAGRVPRAAVRARARAPAALPGVDREEHAHLRPGRRGHRQDLPRGRRGAARACSAASAAPDRQPAGGRGRREARLPARRPAGEAQPLRAAGVRRAWPS